MQTSGNNETTRPEPGTAPADLVQHYIAYSNRLSDHYMDLESRRKDNVLTEQTLREGLQAIRDEVTDTSIALCRAVNRCSEEQQLQMLTSPDECYTDIGNPWYLDDLYARDALYRYILRPSEHATRAHAQHHNRMAAQLKVSGSFARPPLH